MLRRVLMIVVGCFLLLISAGGSGINRESGVQVAGVDLDLIMVQMKADLESEENGQFVRFKVERIVDGSTSGQKFLVFEKKEGSSIKLYAVLDRQAGDNSVYQYQVGDIAHYAVCILSCSLSQEEIPFGQMLVVPLRRGSAIPDYPDALVFD